VPAVAASVLGAARTLAWSAPTEPRQVRGTRSASLGAPAGPTASASTYVSASVSGSRTRSRDPFCGATTWKKLQGPAAPSLAASAPGPLHSGAGANVCTHQGWKATAGAAGCAPVPGFLARPGGGAAGGGPDGPTLSASM